MVFYDIRKKNYASSPPPRENFLGHLKKISCNGMMQKKYSCKQLGAEKKFVHRKIVQPPLKYLMVRPLLKSWKALAGGFRCLYKKTKQQMI